LPSHEKYNKNTDNIANNSVCNTPNPKIETKKRTKPNWYNDFNKNPFHPLGENTKDNQSSH